MDSVDGIQPLLGVGNNPFLLEVLAHQYAANHPEVAQNPKTEASKNSRTSSSEIEANEKSTTADTRFVDYHRLASDATYLRKVDGDLLLEARRLAGKGYMEAAEQYYRTFFSHQRFYHGQTGVNYVYYKAILEYSWMLESQGRRKQAETFLNQQLLERMEEGLKASERSQVARQYIEAMQEMGKLPPKELPTGLITSDTLFRLVKKFMSQGMPEVAREVLAQLEVRQLIRVFRAEEISVRLGRQITGTQQAVQQPLLPLDYTAEHWKRWGLPYAYLPVPGIIPPEDQHRTDSKSIPPIGYYTDLVHPLEALNKDPNPQDEQERRDQAANTYRSTLHKKPQKID